MATPIPTTAGRSNAGVHSHITYPPVRKVNKKRPPPDLKTIGWFFGAVIILILLIKYLTIL